MILFSECIIVDRRTVGFKETFILKNRFEIFDRSVKCFFPPNINEDQRLYFFLSFKILFEIVRYCMAGRKRFTMLSTLYGTEKKNHSSQIKGITVTLLKTLKP